MDEYSGTSIEDLRKKHSQPNMSNQSTQNYSSYDDINFDNPGDQSISQYNTEHYQPSLPPTYNPPVSTQYFDGDPTYNNVKDQISFMESPPKSDKYYYLQEALLIVLLYVILSQPFVIKFFSQFIKLLVPNENTKYVSTTGLVIYGLILGMAFVFIKKYTLPIF